MVNRNPRGASKWTEISWFSVNCMPGRRAFPSSRGFLVIRVKGRSPFSVPPEKDRLKGSLDGVVIELQLPGFFFQYSPRPVEGCKAAEPVQYLQEGS